MSDHVVHYALTLESRQFLTEMARAKREAREASRSIGGAFGASMGEAKTSAQGARNATMAFSSAQMSLSRAMSGDLVGAAGAAAMSIKSLTAALATNPWFALVAALVAVAAAIAKAASASAEYKKRIREAKEENAAFTKSLEELADKWQAGRKQSAFEKRLKEEDSPVIERAIRKQEGKVETARKEAVEASAELEEAQSRRHPNEKQVEELKAKRDAAKEEYEMQLAILGRYKDMYADWNDKQKKAVEDYRKAAGEASKQMARASKAEEDRREYEAAKDDPAKLTELAAKRRAEVASQYGNLFRDDYEERLKRGEATDEEIKARREIEEMEERALELAKKKTEEAKKQREEAEKAAKAAAEEARNRLNNSREDVLVKAGRPEELEKRADRLEAAADRKFGKWSDDKIMSATQEELDARSEVDRIRGLARQARENGKEGPWAEGVVAARGMSIGDVFSQMRGMNGAQMRDPNTEYHRRTAEGTANIERSVASIARALGQEGVH